MQATNMGECLSF